METNFSITPNENEEQYLWRIGQLVEDKSIDSWTDAATIINHELYGEDVDRYKSESAYRKKFQYAEAFFEAGVFNGLGGEEYLNRLNDIKREIEMERAKYRDERSGWSRQNRGIARLESDLNYLGELIKNKSEYNDTPISVVQRKSDNDLVVCLSDIHLGLNVDNNFDTYNSDVAKKRLGKYIGAILDIAKRSNAVNCHVLLLGDMISGNIHPTVQIENRENVVEQAQQCAEAVSEFLYILSKNFANVYVNDVAGNHTRIGKKDDVLRDERLDNIIPWYAKAKLSNVSNVRFLDEQKFDSTISYLDIKGKRYFAVHGDYDSFDANGVQRLSMMCGEIPTGVFYGHKHTCSYTEVANTSLVMSGSFSGAGDDYCIKKRIKGRASQAVCVVDKNGINAFYPVSLD
jgi:hypothetical protein